MPGPSLGFDQRAYKRKWDIAHRDEQRAYHAKWYLAHRADHLERSRKQYRAHRLAVIARQRAYRKTAAGMLTALRHSAKQRGSR